MHAHGTGYSRLDESKPNTQIVIRNSRINRVEIESYLHQLHLEPSFLEWFLTFLHAFFEALGNAELPSSFLWFLTTDVPEVGLGMTDLTLSARPLAAGSAFYGTMAITLIITGLGTRFFYRDEVNSVQERVKSVFEEEFQQETLTRELLFEALRFRALNPDEKTCSDLMSHLPKNFFKKELFLEEVKQLYSKFFSTDSKEANDQLNQLKDSDFASDEEFRHTIIEKMLAEFETLSLSKYFSLQPEVIGDSSKANKVGTMSALLMSGTLFPAWWAIFSLLVSMEIFSKTSLTGFWATSISLIVLGLGVGFLKGSQELTNSKREALAEELRVRNKYLSSTVKKICQLNVTICQQKKRLAATATPSQKDSKPSLKANIKGLHSGAKNLGTFGLHEVGLHAVSPNSRQPNVGAPLRRSKSF